MTIYKSAEDYLERILMLQKKITNVRSIDIATDMNYSKPSISRAIKNLKTDGYIIINEQGYILLTPKGEEIATKIYEKHLVLTNFFKKIGVSEQTALEDACKVEHDLSEETFNALKSFIQDQK